MVPQCPHLARSPVAATSANQTPPANHMSLPLSLQLKTLTQPQHDEAEHHPLHALLFGSQGPVPARQVYVRLLAQHLCIQEAFEPLLIGLAAQTHPFRSLMRPHHLHLAALRADLAVFNVSPEESMPVPATRAFVSFIMACAAGNDCSLLGAWYVFEGSTNGGTIIGKRMRELLGLPTDSGTQFINPHGPLVRARWTEWKTTLDTLNFDEPHRAAIIAAAQETFRLSTALLDDIFTQMQAMSKSSAPDPEAVTPVVTSVHVPGREVSTSL
jgi:heme oxygenase